MTTPCNCGTPDGQDECVLDCLVQPLFFCGQLLNESDLTAIMNWTKSRLRLNRYREGWGVVCGLSVRSDLDSKREGGIIIGPGYAIDCCGNDLVVCDDLALDLRGACAPIKDPCADLRKPDKKMPDDGERVVDIFLRYHETESEPQVALNRSSHENASRCRPSRARETPNAYWETVAVADSVPANAAYDSFVKRYAAAWQIIEDFVKAFPRYAPAKDAAAIQRWLQACVSSQPPFQMCYLRDEICLAAPDAFASEAGLADILFRLMHDRRNTILADYCASCVPGGVPLARVHLSVGADTRGKTRCRVTWIDALPPYRRYLHADQWPAPHGQINLARFLWQDDAVPQIRALGVQVGEEEVFKADDLSKLKSVQDVPLAKPGSTVQPLVYQDKVQGRRIVGFATAGV